MSLKRKRNKIRSQKGVMGVMLFLGALVMAIIIGALGVDIAQITYQRQLIRSIADSAAVAGAQDLYTNPADCERHALAVAQMYLNNNFNGSPPTTNVVATVIRPTATDTGMVIVDIALTCNHHLSMMISRPTDLVNVRAAVRGGGRLIRHSGIKLFPLAVSIDAVPTPGGSGSSSGNGNGNGKGGNGNGNSNNSAVSQYSSQRPLKDLRVGDLAYFHINSQQYKNSAFTSFTIPNTNANWLNHAIDQCLGQEAVQPGYIPSVQIGDQISLINGVASQKDLGRDPLYAAIQNEPVLFFPVIQGDPAYNQSRELLGFIGCHVEQVITNQSGGGVETFVCKIVRAIDTRPGALTGTIPSTGDSGVDIALNDWAPGNLKLCM